MTYCHELKLESMCREGFIFYKPATLETILTKDREYNPQHVITELEMESSFQRISTTTGMPLEEVKEKGLQAFDLEKTFIN
ncbi:hypothetical protein [Piscirickettsia salmonis]|uniref:hypothetical protein n=1 Tax=Piscirickettsia salmonis TaxID=1238 RepID=UPI001E5A04C5|nr:hypothetical protein [Piscirickettsia salmonis]